MENEAPQTYTSLYPDEMNLAVNGTTTAPHHRPRPWTCNLPLEIGIECEGQTKSKPPHLYTACWSGEDKKDSKKCLDVDDASHVPLAGGYHRFNRNKEIYQAKVIVNFLTAGSHVVAMKFSSICMIKTRTKMMASYFRKCFRDRRLEKVFLLVLLVLVLATLVLAIYTFIKLHQHITKTSVTSDTAARSSINKTNPCDDIYYAKCHRWAQAHPKPDDWPSWDRFSKLNFQNNIHLSQIFENSKDSQLESEAEEKAKLFYLTCTDTDGAIERLGKKPIFDLIDKLGGWNISFSKSRKFNSLKFTSTQLQETIQTMKNFAGVDSFFLTKVEPDARNNSNYILTLYPLEEPLGYSPHNYQQYMNTIGTLLEGDKRSVKQQMEAVFLFYKTLLESVSHKPIRKAANISELNNLVSFMRWKEYFQKIVPGTKEMLKSDDVVVLSDLHFFGNLSKLVNDYLEEYDKRIVLKNFLVWRAVERMTAYLPKEFEDARREQLKKTSYISIGRSPVYCAHITNSYFGFATAAAFARKVFDVNSAKLVKLMFNNLRRAFTKKVEHLRGLDQYNREILKNKSDTMTLSVGFPDFILDTNELDKFYSSVNVYEDALFVNVLEAEVHKYQQQFALLRQNPKEVSSSWPLHLPLTPLHIDAIYRKEVNQIVVPMGILQHPDLQTRRQMPLYFGTLDFLLGHEFMHAFVNRELSSDENENSWPQEIKEMFQAIHECVSKDYSKCRSPRDCSTLNEDMADISGLKLAYSAFLDWQANQQQTQIPGAKVISKKEFFLAFVQMWCTSGNNSYDFRHSTFMTRANRPLSYMPEFAQEFNCRPGSMLNPHRRCHVF